MPSNRNIIHCDAQIYWVSVKFGRLRKLVGTSKFRGDLRDALSGCIGFGASIECWELPRNEGFLIVVWQRSGNRKSFIATRNREFAQGFLVKPPPELKKQFEHLLSSETASNEMA